MLTKQIKIFQLRISQESLSKPSRGPEVDAYRFEKLAAFATANGKQQDRNFDENNVYSAIKDGILPVRRYGAQNLLGYVQARSWMP